MEPTVAVGCTVHAPAKLNLCLEVLGKRPDGFHELRTVMATIGLRDTLRVRPTSDSDSALSLFVRGGGSDIPTDSRNLVVRSLVALRRAAGVDRGATIELVKRIPSQAGLGGGSSDAAAALVAGARVWNIDWGFKRLAAIAAQLGSDIPFFVRRLLSPGDRAALATGRGERITPTPITLGVPVVVLKPEEGLSTPNVYRACEAGDFTGRSGPDASASTVSAIRGGNWQALPGAMRNDLQAAAERLAPWLADVRNEFTRLGTLAHQLSGSGSAYYGLTRTVGEARRVAARLRALRVGQVCVTTLG